VQKLLLVDDDEALRRMMTARLADAYQVIDTGEPEKGVGLALEHRPAAILLDLMMPKFSGFELCQNLHSLSYTARIPVFVVSGESAARYRGHCFSLGAQDFFEKPVDFERLRRRLAEVVLAKPVERRARVRVGLRVPIALRGKDQDGKSFEESSATENVSANGFLCSCRAPLVEDMIVDVCILAKIEQPAGRARVVRKDDQTVLVPRYGFSFVEKTNAWVLHDA
jgi:DNA-binding response OmpR family regulator